VPPVSVPPAPPRLSRDRDFRRLWLGQTASQLGEHASLVMLPLIAVLTLDAGPGQLGVLRAVGQAPILLLSLLVGAWVDHWRTRTVMVLADLGRALVLGAALVVGLFGGLLVHQWGLRATLLTTAAGMLLSPLLLSLSPLARLGRTLPAQPARSPTDGNDPKAHAVPRRRRVRGSARR
jgi:hypothetical protein